MDRILDMGTDAGHRPGRGIVIDVNTDFTSTTCSSTSTSTSGNLTIGSACCGARRMPRWRVSSANRVIAPWAPREWCFPAVGLLEERERPRAPAGGAFEFGLFGIVYEATFRVRKLAAMEVHEKFSFQEFSDQLPQLRARGDSMMLYINPFKDGIFTIEFRRYHEVNETVVSAAVANCATRCGATWRRCGASTSADW